MLYTRCDKESGQEVQQHAQYNKEEVLDLIYGKNSWWECGKNVAANAIVYDDKVFIKIKIKKSTLSYRVELHSGNCFSIEDAPKDAKSNGAHYTAIDSNKVAIVSRKRKANTKNAGLCK
jgi:hypothetical protein